MSSMTNKFYFFAKNKLQPIYRSLTGKGNLKTLRLMKKKFPELKINYFESGKKVFDWKVPNEWNIKNAYISDKFGNKIIDFKKIFYML